MRIENVRILDILLETWEIIYIFVSVTIRREVLDDIFILFSKKLARIVLSKKLPTSPRIFQLETFWNFKNWQDSNELPCSLFRAKNEHPLKFGFRYNYKKKKERKKSRVYTGFQEKFTRKWGKNDVAETKERASGLANFFSLVARTRLIKERNFPVVARGRHGSSARGALWRRARASTFACPNSTFSFPPPPCSSRVGPQRSLLFILRYFRRSCDRLKMRRRLAGNGTEDGEVRARRRWKRGEQRIVPTGFTRSLWTGKRGDTSLVCEEEGGEGVILPCVTRITRAALKSTRRTFYRGQS